MLTRRLAYLGLLLCLVATTALGVQPKRAESTFVEQEAEADAPAGESGEEEIEGESGILLFRRRTALDITLTVMTGAPSESPRSEDVCELPTRHQLGLASRNGFGGPLRL
jgi:hypothetical protein